ncbi:MAG: hypothetical protein KF777_04085 [Planctomycetaceae bacterium]|nr:hypothetical protein [Planctomycetaceae bacterium]
MMTKLRIVLSIVIRKRSRTAGEMISNLQEHAAEGGTMKFFLSNRAATRSGGTRLARTVSRAWRLIVPLGLVVGLGSAVLAQYGDTRVGWGFSSPWGGWGWNFSGPLGSTPAESYARGMADLTRAQGEAYANAARGAIDFEAARQSYIQNQQLWQQTMQERRRMALSEREADTARRLASRDRWLATRQSAATESLSEARFDKDTGHIEWPTGLQGDEFAAQRDSIARGLEVLSRTSGHGDTATHVVEQITSLQADLRAKITQMDAGEYIEARKFLESLRSQIQQLFLG